MKPVVTKSLTHLCAAGVGILLVAGTTAVAVNRKGKEKPAAEAPAAAKPVRPERADRPLQIKKEMRQATPPRFTAKECQAAWDAIGKRNLTRQERLNYQRQVLLMWAEVDPEAALKAALASPWDEQGSQGQLLGAFHGYFSKQPVESWDLLKSGKLGLGSSLVMMQWAYSVAPEHPALVMGYFNEFPDARKTGLLQNIAMNVRNDPQKRDEFMEKVAELEESKQFNAWAKMLAESFAGMESTETLREKFLGADSPQKTTLYLHMLGYSLKDADMSAIRDEWAKMPPEMQGRAARAFALHSDPNGTKNTPGLFDMLVKTNEWDFMNTEKWRLGRYANTPERKEDLAKWALTLPETSGSQEIFHRAVEPFINLDINRAGDWIETLPKGWQRDRALAELSQRSLWAKKNTELSDWALSEISDPKLKADATKWRGDWARQTKQPQ